MQDQHPSSEQTARSALRSSLELPGYPEVSVFRLRYRFEAEPDPATRSLLREEELERMARFRFVEDRVRFAATRAALRELLGAALKLPPGSVPLELGQNGKPVLAPALGVHFNVSHSGAEGLIALSRAGAVGVDVELTRPDVEFRSVAARMFSPSEVAELEGLDEGAARERFYRGWTYKEAVLKALGLGIASDTRCFAVLERTALGVSADPTALPVPPERLRVAALPAPTGYAAAIAIVV